MNGAYRHFKGGVYQVIGVACHTATDEDLVIYRGVEGFLFLYARPKRMWDEMIEYEGKTVPRFTRITIVECHRCEGKGKRNIGYADSFRQKPCSRCNGTGKIEPGQ